MQTMRPSPHARQQLLKAGQGRKVERYPSESLRWLIGLTPIIDPSGYLKDEENFLSPELGTINVVLFDLSKLWLFGLQP